MNKLQYMTALLVGVAFAGLGSGYLVVAQSQAEGKAEANLNSGAIKTGESDQTTPHDAKSEIADDAKLVTTLAQARVSVARTIADDMEKLWKGGGVPYKDYSEALDRVMEAELDSTSDRSERIAILRGRVKLSSTIDQQVRKLVNAGGISKHEANLVTYARLEVALKLAAEKSGKSPSSSASLKTKLDDPEEIATLIDGFNSAEQHAALLDLLDKPISFDVSKPLAFDEFLKTIKSIGAGRYDSGLPIYVDPAGLQRAGATMETTGKLTPGKRPAKEFLKEFLDPIGMRFSVSAGLLQITQKK